MSAREPLIPQLALVRVVAGGGPYRQHDVLSMAFVEPAIGRLLKHGDNGEDPAPFEPPPMVPETICVEVVQPAAPHARADRLVLAFIDPTLARVVPGYRAPNGEAPPPARSPAAAPPEPLSARAPEMQTMQAVLRYERWGESEARRFIAVVDKLFTIDRLGWYRHSLAMRLLLADAIVVSDAKSSAEATRHLTMLRAAAADALNAPLLAVYMPHFEVDSEWLSSIETPAMISSIADLCEVLDRPNAGVEPAEMAELSGTVGHDEWLRWGSCGVDTFLALLLPNGARLPSVGQRLADYRTGLLELFGQMSQAPAAVRTSHLTQANHLLDDRLWNLAGALQDAWGVNAPA